MARSKRPMDPGWFALIIFGILLFGGTIVLGLVIPDGKDKVARITRGGEGVVTFSVIMMIMAYFAWKDRVKKWEARQKEQEREETKQQAESRQRCSFCNTVFIPGDEPWPHGSFCSKKCRETQAKSGSKK